MVLNRQSFIVRFAENGSEPGGRARTRYKVILKWAMYIKL